MLNQVERMLEDFQKGRLSRREAAARLVALAGAFAGFTRTARGSQAPASTLKAVGVNHIALAVTDVSRSRDFYVRHLGLDVARESSNNCFLTCGNQFVAMFQSGEAGLDHYSYAIEGFDRDAVAEKLEEQNVNLHAGGGPGVTFLDPDGIEVQLVAPGHRP